MTKKGEVLGDVYTTLMCMYVDTFPRMWHPSFTNPNTQGRETQTDLDDIREIVWRKTGKIKQATNIRYYI